MIDNTYTRFLETLKHMTPQQVDEAYEQFAYNLLGIPTTKMLKEYKHG
jgi:hypothetical protein